MTSHHTAPPDSSALIRAFGSELEPVHAVHPVVELAEALVAHHRQRYALAENGHPGTEPNALMLAQRLLDELDARRAGLIDKIDGWALAVINARPTAPLHTETLGSVIDRLALLWMHANKPRTASAGRHVSADALGQLAELSEAYDYLVRDLAQGGRRLPMWRPIKRGDTTSDT